MKKGIISIFLTLISANIAAQDEAQTEYNFLRLPVSAHVAALGGENVTIVDDDPQTMFSNPALIVGATSRSVSLGYMKYMSECNYANAAYNVVVDDKWHIGAGVQYMGYGSMKMTDMNNTDLGTFNATDLAVSGVLGYQLTEHLVGGISAKFIYGNISYYTSLAVAADLGLNYYLPETDWSFGLVLKNLGGQVQSYDEEFEKLPFDVQLGVTKRLVGSPFRISATLVDLNHLNYKVKNHLCVGLDAIFSPQFYLSAGYNFRRAAEMGIINEEGLTSSHGAGLSLGAGINIQRMMINVAYAKYHVSASTLVASLTFRL